MNAKKRQRKKTPSIAGKHLWDQIGIPHKGWQCVDVEELEEASHTCEMCGKEEIRFVHTMRHPKYEHALEVGCVCAEKMDKNYDGKAAERRVHNRRIRRESFLEPYWWKVGTYGAYYRRYKGKNIFIPKRGGWWHIEINRVLQRYKYSELEEAMNAAFEILGGN